LDVAIALFYLGIMAVALIALGVFHPTERVVLSAWGILALVICSLWLLDLVANRD
jgi:hypothetical protein